MRVHTTVAVATMLLLAGGLGRADAQPAAMGWQGFANAWIASHAARVKGEAPKESRKSCEGDVNGDGHSDVVVIYTIEGVGGGNDWTQYATVLTSTAQGYGASLPKEVGGKGVRGVEACAIDGNTVALDLMTYGPKDGSCCPSVPGKARYTFAKGVLVEAPAASASGAPAPSPGAK
jgi:hypothetical protein